MISSHRCDALVTSERGTQGTTRKMTQPTENNFPTAEQTTTETARAVEVLRLENIHAGYGKKEVLRGVSFSVRAGEIVALIGINGAGKSTALKVAAGLVRPWQGSVWFNGCNITGMPVHQRARIGLSYLMQGGEVFQSLTVRENIEMSTLVVPPDERKAAIESAVERFPILREKMNVRAGLLSGGQRQMLAIAMVLAQRPKVVLLDEPSAGLAPNLAQEILSKLRTITMADSVACLLVEQRMRESLKVAQKALWLNEGWVIEETARPSLWLDDSKWVGHLRGENSVVNA